jgi:hypothetical protein
MCLKYFVIAVPILMVTFFNPLIYFLSIYTYCKGEMLPSASPSEKQLIQNEIIQKIMTSYSWGIPKDLLNDMKSRLAAQVK